MDQIIRRHVLIIEDDAFFSELLARNLLKRNFRVTAVPTLADAREPLKEGGCDVVCFDIVVSGGEGIKSLSEFKTSGFFKNIPLLLLVDREFEQEVVKWVDEDAVTYLIKNECSPDEIALKIEAIAIVTSL